MTPAPGLGRLPHRFPKAPATPSRKARRVDIKPDIYFSLSNERFPSAGGLPPAQATGARPRNSICLGPSGVFGWKQALRSDATGQGTNLADPSAKIYPKGFPNSVCLRWECSLESPWLPVPPGTCRESQ